MKKLIIAMLGAVALLLALFTAPAQAATNTPSPTPQAPVRLAAPLCITSAQASLRLQVPVTKLGAKCALPLRKAVPAGWKVVGKGHGYVYVLRGYVPSLDAR